MSAQLMLLVLGAIVLANALAALLFVLSRDQALHHNPAEVTGRLAGMVEVLDRAAPAERGALLVAFAAAHPEFHLVPAAGPPPAGSRRDEHLARALGPRFEVSTTHIDEPGAHQHIIRLSDGATLEAMEPRPPHPPFPGPQLTSLLIGGLSLGALLLWSGLKVTKPLNAITRAAERFRPEVNPPPLKEEGPYEVKALARAFNTMQGRISELLTEKTDALAAVSHDLRTPITRMRLRAEFLPDTAERARMIHDLDLMDQLTQSALNHLRAVATGTDRELLDLAGLLHTLADNYQDQGLGVKVLEAERLVAKVRPLDLERALDNLIENACKYANPPSLRLYRKGEEAIIEIEDHGPGIAPARREELMRPYTRGDHARGLSETRGFGLGMAIARQAAERQGGQLSLHDASPQGLLVRITLPLA